MKTWAVTVAIAVTVTYYMNVMLSMYVCIYYYITNSTSGGNNLGGLLCYAMLCYAMLRYAMLCYAMLINAMRCDAMRYIRVEW